MKPGKPAVALSATALLTASLLMSTASPAQATLDNCTTWIANGYAYGTCAGGTGEQHIRVTVQHVNPQVGFVFNDGPWVGAGATSAASIPPGTVLSYYVVKR